MPEWTLATCLLVQILLYFAYDQNIPGSYSSLCFKPIESSFLGGSGLQLMRLSALKAEDAFRAPN